MPLPKGPEVREQILKLRAEGVPTREIAKQIGVHTSTVSYHVRNARLNKPPLRTNGVDPNLEKQIANYSIRGLAPKEIAKRLGVTIEKVYYIRYRGKRHKGVETAIVKGKIAKANSLGQKVFELKQTGISYREIASMLKRPLGTVHSAAHWYRKNQEGGTLVTNGHKSASSTNANGDISNHPTKGELIGYAWAEVERGIATLSQRIALDPLVLRRRLSELLGFETVR